VEFSSFLFEGMYVGLPTYVALSFSAKFLTKTNSVRVFTPLLSPMHICVHLTSTHTFSVHIWYLGALDIHR
jgi:hypothetical protein